MLVFTVAVTVHNIEHPSESRSVKNSCQSKTLVGEIHWVGNVPPHGTRYWVRTDEPLHKSERATIDHRKGTYSTAIKGITAIIDKGSAGHNLFRSLSLSLETQEQADETSNWMEFYLNSPPKFEPEMLSYLLACQNGD